MAKARRKTRWLVVALGAAAALAGVALALADVETALDAEDRAAIASLGLDGACRARASYEDDVACIRALQQTLAERSPDLACVHRWGEVSHEPKAFLERGRGCCYDRSRIIEKTLAGYGFPVRHMSLHELRLPAPFGYLEAVPSHSTSEARTRRGWMVVDSNRLFLARDARGEPLDARELRDALLAGRPLAEPATQDYFAGDYSIFYGLYSRHGGFFPPFAPVPDVDVAQLGHNLE